MEQSNKVQEEQIKQDDVQVSAQGEQAAVPQAEKNLSGQLAQAGLVNQTNEVPNGSI